MDTKETETKDEIEAIDIIPKKINIMVDTNIEGEAPFPLTYDKIYNPVKSETLPQPKNPDYPYFITNVKYSEKVLMSYLIKDYSLILLSFFDKKYFSNMIQDFINENKKLGNQDKQEYVNHNIFLTLLFLFPMRYPRPANISTSYSKYICKDDDTYTDLVNNFISGKNTTSSAFLRNMRDIETSVREYSYINSSKGQSTVTEIVWLNDVLNNPSYRELVDLLIQYESWVKNKKITIKNEIDTAINGLVESEKISITDDDINIIKEQKNTAYSKNDFIEDILKIATDYIYVDYNGEIDDNRQKRLEIVMKTIIKETKGAIKKYIENPEPEDNNNKNAKIDTDKLIEKILLHVFYTNENGSRNRYYGESNAIPVVMDYLKFNDKITYPNVILRNKKENKFEIIDLSNIKIYGKEISKLNLQRQPNKQKGGTGDEDADENEGYNDELDRIEEQKNTGRSFSRTTNKPQTSINNNIFRSRSRTTNANQSKNKNIKVDENSITTKSVKIKKYNDQNYDIIIGDFLPKFKDALFSDARFEEFKKNLTNDIDKLLTKYNNNLVKSAQIDTRIAAAYLDIDIRINKAVDGLNALNEALKSNTDKNFEKIVNAVDSLKTFFTDQSIKENRLTGVYTIKQKFEKILKKTNIIKTLKYIEENIINSPGINLNYKSESPEFNTVLNSELENEKYSYFMNTVSTINKNFLNIQTTNETLEKIIKDYFNNRTKDLITLLIQPAKKAINENRLDDCKNRYMETGVSISTSSSKKLYEYEINVYMEVVIGKIDYQTQNNIKCDYRDEKLVAYFNRDSMYANNFEIVKSKAIALNKQPNQKDAKIQNNQNNQNNQSNQNNQKKTKGGKTTRKKKYVQYLQNNKRYTSKRRFSYYLNRR
jgi:hypothetical protein